MSTAIETPYTPLIIATAPESSGQILEKIQESFSFIPNLMAIFGNNPVLAGYSALHAIYNEGFSRPGNVNRFCWWQKLKTIATTAQQHIPQSRKALFTSQLRGPTTYECGHQQSIPGLHHSDKQISLLEFHPL